MQEYIDYVFVEDTRTIGKENFMEQVKGLFVGTQNYFFFFPEKAELFEQTYSTSTVTKTTYTYDGKPVPEYILEQLNAMRSVREFEAFVTTELHGEMSEWIYIHSLEDISEFKVNANWMGSSIVARFNNKKYSGATKFTATPVVLTLGKKKKEIKAFYVNHPKCKSKK